MPPAAPPQRSHPLEYNILMTATLCLLAAGAVMVYSASSARTLLQGQGDGSAFLVKYVMYGAVGLVVMPSPPAAAWTRSSAPPARCSR